MNAYNLDDQDEREDFLRRCAEDPEALAADIFADHLEHARVWVDTLHAYAEIAQQAFQARLGGDIPQALALEARADELYNTLPDEAKAW